MTTGILTPGILILGIVTPGILALRALIPGILCPSILIQSILNPGILLCTDPGNLILGILILDIYAQELIRWAWAVHLRVTGDEPDFDIDLVSAHVRPFAGGEYRGKRKLAELGQ